MEVSCCGPVERAAFKALELPAVPVSDVFYKQIHDMVEQIAAAAYALGLRDGRAEKSDEKDVHTEHCCVEHGCKYGDDDCPVENGVQEQSYPCQDCNPT